MKQLISISLGVVLLTGMGAHGQQVATDKKAGTPAAAPAQAQARLAPLDRAGALTLVRSTIIALQQANQTNNYSVLYAMSAPAFQSKTPTDKLMQNFEGLRNTKLDLSGVAVLEPQFLIVPQIDGAGVMRMAGYFPSAPMQINFDLQFTPIDNRWKLLGLTVSVSPSSPIAPGSPAASPAAKTSPTPAPKKK